SRNHWRRLRSPFCPVMRRSRSIFRLCSTAAMTQDRTLVRLITVNPRSSPLWTPIKRPGLQRCSRTNEIESTWIFRSDRCYDAGPYAREVDYGESQIIPPLDANQAAWATAMLQNKRD